MAAHSSLLIRESERKGERWGILLRKIDEEQRESGDREEEREESWRGQWTLVLWFGSVRSVSDQKV
jgi:hypothetical protein